MTLPTPRLRFAAQAAIFKRKHNWLMPAVPGTFGSFIGYAAGFPLLIKASSPTSTLAYAWLGRWWRGDPPPRGGWLADKLGGARHAVELHRHGHCRGGRHGVPAIGQATRSSLAASSCASWLFLTTGIGNGSTFRMIPVIFLTEAMRGVDKNNAAAVAQPTRKATPWALPRWASRLRWLRTAGSSFPRLRQLHRAHRQPPCRAVDLLRVLSRVHRDYLVVLRPQERRDALLSRPTEPQNRQDKEPPMSHFLDRLTYFSQPADICTGGHGDQR